MKWKVRISVERFDETDLANTYGAKSFFGRKGERETYGDRYRGRVF